MIDAFFLSLCINESRIYKAGLITIAILFGKHVNRESGILNRHCVPFQIKPSEPLYEIA